MWSAIYRSVAEFFAWVASVNDDITGANDNPNVFAAVAKLLVILLFAGAAFALAILVCRSLGFL